MKQLVTTGIILSRIDYGEADRIITLLTPDHGKLRLMAKGVRRIKSKLAGGIELFSVSNITFIQGRGEVGTLISTRLLTHYGRIVEDLDRTMLGYELIKQLNKATEDHPEAEYFQLLQQAFEALNTSTISLQVIRFWFAVQLLQQAGHTPNLQIDVTGQKLSVDQTYNFDFDAMCFAQKPSGTFAAEHIKFLRLAFGHLSPAALSSIQDNARLLSVTTPLVQTMLSSFVRV